MMFAILFGLSMDYEVFLVTRIYEEWHRTRDNTLAVTRGLAATGRTITAAAAIMILVFGSFILGGQIIIEMFGLGLAVAVLLDALIVRSILVPSLMLIIGKANWALPKRLTGCCHISTSKVMSNTICRRRGSREYNRAIWRRRRTPPDPAPTRPRNGLGAWRLDGSESTPANDPAQSFRWATLTDALALPEASVAVSVNAADTFAPFSIAWVTLAGTSTVSLSGALAFSLACRDLSPTVFELFFLPCLAAVTSVTVPASVAATAWSHVAASEKVPAAGWAFLPFFGFGTLSASPWAVSVQVGWRRRLLPPGPEEDVYAHTAPAAPSPEPPTTAVLPSEESETASPKLLAPDPSVGEISAAGSSWCPSGRTPRVHRAVVVVVATDQGRVAVCGQGHAGTEVGSSGLVGGDDLLLL